MATSPTAPFDGGKNRERTNTMSSVAHSVHSVTHTVQTAATELLHKDPPPGFFAATADAASQAPTISEIRRGSFDADGWHEDRQLRRRTLSQSSAGKRISRRISEGESQREVDGGLRAFPALTEEPSHVSRLDGTLAERQEPEISDPSPRYLEEEQGAPVDVETHELTSTSSRTDHGRLVPISGDRRVYSSGYVPPPVIPWTTSTGIALKAFWKWFCTPFGFLITLYGLNVVAWGGMLFLLLCNASPQMCWAPIHTPENQHHMSPAAALALNSKYPRYRNCNDINSPRRVWLEIDSQILNALFCVTGFGLIPWRFRDWYLLLLWRCTSEKRSGRIKKLSGLRVLAGIYRNWVRLPDSHTLDQLSSADYQRRLSKESSTSDSTFASVEVDLETAGSGNDTRLPLPLEKAPDSPLTGVRAPPTALWKIDFFVWSQVLNTFFQVCLCGFMWGMSRYNRPSWSTGLFIALACIIAGLGGLVSYLEGKKVKRVEGVRAQHLPDRGTAGDEVANGLALEQTRTGHESLHIDADEKVKN